MAKTPAPESVKSLLSNITTLSRDSIELYERAINKGNNTTLASKLAKAASRSIAETSRGITTGLKPHPFDMSAVAAFMHANPYHSTCIATKVNSTVGLGFLTKEGEERQKQGIKEVRAYEQSKVDEVLNQFCDISFQDVLTKSCDGFHQCANGLMEVRREKPTIKAPITGLHPIPPSEARIYVEEPTGTRHWQINGKEGNERHFAMFGDIDDFVRRQGKAKKDLGTVSEVIHFPEPSILSRWYGYPSWLSAVAFIELFQAVLQDKFDFHLNRGVPEFFMFILGAKLETEDWEKIENALKANIGIGNGHKSLALNIEKKDLEIQIEKLAVEKQGDEFASMLETLALGIVSAHRVPPLLAGILIPGKLGATNELPNAMMAFQLLSVNQWQRTFQQTLGTTLGNKELVPNLDLELKDFTFNRITDQMDLGVMATVGGMRETLPQANAKGRDLKAGLKD